MLGIGQTVWMADTEATRERNRQVVEQFFACDLKHPEQRLSLWGDDGVKEFPWAPENMLRTRWEGRAELTENAEHLARMLSGFAHTEVEVQATEDPELFWVTSVAAPTSTKDGAPFPMRYIHMLRVRDGQVVLHREYFDSLRMYRVLAGCYDTGADPEAASAARADEA